MRRVCDKMLLKVLRLSVFVLLFFVQINHLSICKETEEDIPLDTHNNIRVQQYSHTTPLLEKHPQLGDEQHINKFAFMCGRCQICHAGYYFSKDEVGELPIDSCCPIRCCHYTTYCLTGIAGSGSIAASFIWDLVRCCKPPLGSCLSCAFTTYTPAIAGSSLLGFCLCHGTTGGVIYCCAGCMGKKEFQDDFRRGLYCAPTDCLSPTNLWQTWSNCWNPCCGKSDYKSV